MSWSNIGTLSQPSQSIEYTTGMITSKASTGSDTIIVDFRIRYTRIDKLVIVDLDMTNIPGLGDAYIEFNSTYFLNFSNKLPSVSSTYYQNRNYNIYDVFWGNSTENIKNSVIGQFTGRFAPAAKTISFTFYKLFSDSSLGYQFRLNDINNNIALQSRIYSFYYITDEV